MNNWYNIKVASSVGGVNEVFIYEEIGAWGITASQFVRDLQALSGKIQVRINSLGGSVFDAIAIHSYLSKTPEVETIVDGIAASAASMIFAAGKVRKMASSAYLMIHNPWSFAMGGSEDMRKEADILDKIANTLSGIYVAASSKTVEEVKAMMDAETWMDGVEALASGFATEIVSGSSPKASIQAGRFNRTPSTLIAAPVATAETKPTAPPNMSNRLLALLGINGSEREQFLASAFTALGVTESAIETAQKEGKPDFLAEHINARITDLAEKLTDAEKKALEAEARATAQEGTAKALLSALGVNDAGTDPAATVETAIKAKASAEAAEILASKGITKALDTAKASTSTTSKSREEIVAEFNGMKPGPERSAFFAQHKAALV